MLDEILKRLQGLPEKEKAELIAETMEATKHMRFVPLAGPQTDAYLSQADILLYGGQAGGGKTGLLVGLAQEHESSIIFRREVAQTDGLEKFGKEVYGADCNSIPRIEGLNEPDLDGFNGSDLEWSWEGGRSLKLAGMKDANTWQKHAGRARQYMGFDEAGEFLVNQIASLLAWLRGKPGQRCRMVLASNPPRTAEGAWMLDWFAPWFEHNHPFKAKPGELRWAFMDPERSTPIWVSGPEARSEDNPDDKPISFTFIPAKLEDNPHNDTPEYRARLNALPEPLRSQLKKGIFAISGEDDEWQMIPTAWIQAAMDRWSPKPPDQTPMCALGADVAQGGKDNTTLAPRYDGWYDRIKSTPGAQTPGGREVAGLVIANRKHNATIILDVGGGWGADAYGCLRGDNGLSAQECVAYMGIKASMARSRDGLFKFTNLRTQLYWQFREALDPEQHGGSPICLPPDKELLADLAAMHYEPVTRSHVQHIEGESKESVCDRLGRSPDKGDAVVMSWYAGAKVLAKAQPASEEQGSYRRGRGGPQVSYGPRRPHGMNRR
jgi:hypothetical protein